MPFIADLAKKAREKNILTGMIITDLIAFISYIIFSSGIFYFGDLQMTIGCIIGSRFALKNNKSNKSFIIQSIGVSLVGAVLTAVSFTLFDWFVFSEILRYSLFMLLITFELYLIEAIIIGLVIGGIVGGYYNYKNKNRIESTTIKEEFYESLIDK